jgi:hypothetical protein
MTPKELIRRRLQNQLLSSAGLGSPAEVVSHFGAMQAQDYFMAKWAVALRMDDANHPLIENAIQSGEIIRTHILRPTWHFVSRHDIRWMMRLSAPYVKKATQYVDRNVGLTDALFRKAWKIIEPNFKQASSLTKEDIMSILAKRKVEMDNMLAAQFIMRAEIDMLLCNGVRKKKDTAYALFDEVVPASAEITKEEALAKLAFTYFKSRGPATMKDFIWWSGLRATDAKLAASAQGKTLLRVMVNDLEYLYFDSGTKPANKLTSLLLPPYDEYMVGYYNGRDIAFSDSSVEKADVGNGIFKPIVLMDNTVAGIWRKVKKKPFAEMEALNTPPDDLDTKLSRQLKRFTLFNEGRD